MRPQFKKYADKDLDEISSQLNFYLSRLAEDNFRTRYLTGITNVTANTQQTFPHGMKPRPFMAVPVSGNVYVQSIDNTNIDVRSTQTSIPFTLLVFGKN